MRHPNEFWLKYLIVCAEMSYSDICDITEMYGFPRPSRDYIDELADRLNETKPRPFRRNSAKVKDWIRRQRIASLAFNDKEAAKSREFLEDKVLRNVLEILLIANTERAMIPDICLALTGKKPSLTSIELFEHYFWKVDLLTLKEWESYLRTHPEHKALIAARERGPEFALWKLGHRVEIPKLDMLNTIKHEATMRFLETGSMNNGKDTALTAKLWSEVLFKAEEELSKTGDPIKKIMEDLKSISIKLDSAPVKDMKSLTGGFHSANVGVEKK